MIDSRPGHAEINTVYGINAEGADILLVRPVYAPTHKKNIRRMTGLSNSKPCFMCVQILNFVGIKSVFYTDTIGELRKIKL